jgi:hypothetical protein
VTQARYSELSVQTVALGGLRPQTAERTLGSDDGALVTRKTKGYV